MCRTYSADWGWMKIQRLITNVKHVSYFRVYGCHYGSWEIHEQLQNTIDILNIWFRTLRCILKDGSGSISKQEFISALKLSPE